MIISHPYKFIFLKTRKTAGTSIEIALSKFCGKKDMIAEISDDDENIRRELGYPGPQNINIPYRYYSLYDWKQRIFRAKIKQYYNHMSADVARKSMNSRVWNSYFKFSFERNPWDKVVSLYYFLVGTQHLQQSFPDFIRTLDRSLLSNYPIYSVNGRVAVDYLGRYETLDADLKEIARKIGLPEIPVLPRAKGGFRKDNRPYQELYGQEERNIVADACQNEIALLNYSFSG